jgi:16S rRNA (guanine527-N7)-methyltransferase
MKDDTIPAMLDLWQSTFHWQPSDRQIGQFTQLYRAILEGNQQQNLTRIIDIREFWEKHLWDSLLGVAPFLFPDCDLAILSKKITLPTQLKIIDIGTGAGFPGLPIAIADSNCSIAMVDSTRKKIAFILKAIAELQLSNAHAFVGRAEALGREFSHREQYDLALIRAVGQASVCAEYVLPFVKVGGWAILYRGHWQESETIALKSVVEQLGSQISLIQPAITPLSQSIRHCIYLYKHSPLSDRFPRQVGIPNQQPL